MPPMTWIYAGAAALSVMLAGCGPAAETSPPAADYAAIVASPDRPEADRGSDDNRRPAAVLGLIAPQPGDTILEIEAGGGYFTELFSRAVGPDGKVYMQNPAAFDAFLGDAVPQRLDGRLANVDYIRSDFDAFGLPDGSVDIVTWFQGPHELWYRPENAPAGFGNPERSFAEISRVLKPGDGDVGAGLTFRESSDLLHNPDDSGLTNVFDPAIRGRTDQAILIFERP